MGNVMLLNHAQLINIGDTYTGRAYIAGEGNGLVTVNGQPAARQVVALEQDTLAVARRVWSTPSGRYVLYDLDPAKQYVVLGVDWRGEYEPVAWDRITPWTNGAQP